MRSGKDLSQWIMISLIIVVTIYITLVYISLRISFRKNKTNPTSMIIRSYPCYLNIILILIIEINNLTRLITTSEEDSFACKLQAFILACFDKLIGTQITVNAFLTYKGLTDNDYYIQHIKPLFIILNSIALLISFIFALIFTIRGTTYSTICYVKGEPPKEIPDTIITSILFSIYLFCSLKTTLYLAKTIKELSFENENHKTFTFHYYRMCFSLILCSFFFIITLLIINDSLFFSFDYVDIVFITLCLIIDLFFTINITIVKQTIKCCKRNKQEENKNQFDDEHYIELPNYNENSKSLKHLENF